MTQKYLIQDGNNIKSYTQNNSLSFDGMDDYIDCGNSTVFNLTTAWTMEMWINRAQDSGAYERIISKSDINVYDYWFQIIPGGTIQCGYIDTIGAGRYVSDITIIPLNTWVHVVAVFNGSNITILINGSISTVSADFPNVPRTSSIPLSLGRLGAGGVWYYGFNSKLSDVRIWNVARTQAEIQANMNNQLVGNELGLIGYWKLDEGTGLIVHDFTSNGNNGTLTNSPTWTISSAIKTVSVVGSAPATESMFLTSGFNDTTIINQWDIQSLTSMQPVVLFYTTDSLTHTSTLTTVPLTGSLLLNNSNGDISTTDFTSINSINIATVTGAGDVIKVIASVDEGVTWKTWNGTDWVTITADSATVKANGMSPSTLNLIGVNVAPLAVATASSEYADGNYPASKTIDGTLAQPMGAGEWASNGEPNPWIQLTWSSSQTISRIVLYDRPNPYDQSDGGTLSFSDGSSITVTGMPGDGSAKEILFPSKTVTWVKFQIASAAGVNNGLWEFQASQSSWASLKALGSVNKLRFGYYIEAGNSVGAEVDTLTINVSMTGQWSNALEGTDYKYGYARTNEIRVKLFVNGDYKFNW
jgi:hypothetical protein